MVRKNFERVLFNILEGLKQRYKMSGNPVKSHGKKPRRIDRVRRLENTST